MFKPITTLIAACMAILMIAFVTAAHADCYDDPIHEAEMQWGLLQTMPGHNPTALVDSITVTAKNAQGIVHSYMIALIVKQSRSLRDVKFFVTEYCEEELAR